MSWKLVPKGDVGNSTWTHMHEYAAIVWRRGRPLFCLICFDSDIDSDPDPDFLPERPAKQRSGPLPCRAI